MAIGITGFGAAVPKRRIRVEDIHSVWQNTGLELLKSSLQLTERCVLNADEDTLTLAVEAAKEALLRSGVDPAAFGALYFGSCTNPYDSRPSVTTIAEALGFPRLLYAADVQFGGKSGTSALLTGYALVRAGMARHALAIGADTINRHCPPGDLYEYTASAAGAAVTIGAEGVVAEIVATTSSARELVDFFRIEGDRYIKAGMGLGGEVWELGLQNDTAFAGQRLLAETATKPSDYRYAVFQQPFGNTALAAGAKLGFAHEQITPAITANQIGDSSSASTLLGLCKVLDEAKPGDKIFLVSYGFGAGSDAIALTVGPAIEQKRSRAKSVQSLIDAKLLVDYATSAKLEFKYLRPEFPLAPNL